MRFVSGDLVDHGAHLHDDELRDDDPHGGDLRDGDPHGDGAHHGALEVCDGGSPSQWHCYDA